MKTRTQILKLAVMTAWLSLLGVAKSIGANMGNTITRLLGLRWDISDRFVTKAVYRFDWTSFEGASGATLYKGFLVILGFQF